MGRMPLVLSEFRGYAAGRAGGDLMSQERPRAWRRGGVSHSASG